MNAETFLAEALVLVESKSIREWALSEHNRPIFIKLAEKALQKSYDAHMFAAYIVSCAIGL